jgi:endogenous inhibitor of DNA gyrase (YacG/DUF329 family)
VTANLATTLPGAAGTFCPTCHPERERERSARRYAIKREIRIAKQATRQCANCGKPIADGRADRKFCSDACKQAAWPAARCRTGTAAPSEAPRRFNRKP